jgi:membrane fusion protein (multidrug efflux system)
LLLSTDLPGRTAAFRVAEIRPQVSGILKRRLFTEGTNVKAGQQLYQIDSNSYDASLMKAQANLLSAESLAHRYESLRDTNAISQQQYVDAISSWRQAQADVKSAQINVVYTKVLSPISGRIGRSTYTEGALATNGQTQALATVQQIDPIFVDVTQSSAEILKLQSALAAGTVEHIDSHQAKVQLTLEDGSHYPLSGTLNFSEVSVDQGTGSVLLRATFPNPNGKLLPGMFVHASLVTAKQNQAILVPQQAVIRDAKGLPTVWVVNRDQSVAMRNIQTQRTVGNTWLVDKGLSAGERIVTEGLQRLRPGMKVVAAKANNVQAVTQFTTDSKGR